MLAAVVASAGPFGREPALTAAVSRAPASGMHRNASASAATRGRSPRADGNRLRSRPAGGKVIPRLYDRGTARRSPGVIGFTICSAETGLC
jgi:hypothetical protein